MKRLSTIVFLTCVACLMARVADAAIPVGTVQNFNTAPSVADWSTITNGGVTATFPDATTLDAAIQTNIASAINFPLPNTAADGTAQVPRYLSNATTRVILTRPTGIGYASVMATIQNTTGGTLGTVAISYDLGNPTPLPASEDPGLAGLRVYHSLTGLENSWTLIPQLTSGTAGGLAVNLALGSWPANALLYVLFVDDNGGPAGDGSYSIDNFLVATTIPPPVLTQNPANATNLVSRTVSLSVVATGSGLMYQWHKVGVGPIDTLVNPSAATATLTITNAQLSDTGDYFVIVSNLGGTVTSANAHIEILPDTAPPRFLLASVVGPGLNTFRLITDEELCIDPLGLTCAIDSTSGFNWGIYPSDDPTFNLGVVSVTQINPTTYEFGTDPINPRDPSKQYRITVEQFGEVGDLYGNRVPEYTYAETLPQASFQQGDANGYAGTHDAEIHSNANADVPLGANAVINVDNDDAGVAQALLKFGGIFGAGPGQIPASATIVNAILTLNQTDPGSDINLHRMLVDWDQASVTWNSMNNGVTADGVEAVAASDALKTGTIANGPLTINVTASLQAWANGAPNYGWAFLSTGGDGWRWNSQESGASTAPLLTIEYRVGVCSGLPVITVQPPAAVPANELQAFSITVGVSNACGTLQWTKDGTDISGANSLTYSVASAGPSDAGTYRLRATNPAGSVTSGAAVVAFVAKTSSPHVTRVASSANGTTITVAFSEAVSSASAQNTANYTLTPSVAVTSAVLGANNTVTLTTAARTLGTAYSLRIAGVTDISSGANLINPNPTIVSLTSAGVVAGAGFGGTWLYNSNNLDSTAGAWKDTGYVPDATWGSGPAAFGIETSAAVIGAAPTPIMTPLSANSVAPGDTLTTTYFRRSITLPALPAGARYVICHYTDDGHITYLDGVEINRYAMPAGAVTFTNRSTGIPNGGEASMRTFSFTATPGAHTLAVELHQAGTTSSDVWFDMEVRIVGGPSPTLSITSNPDRSATLRWNADGNWQLRSSANVAGPYVNNVAVPAANLLGTFTIPTAAATTNNNFYLLDYICLP